VARARAYVEAMLGLQVYAHQLYGLAGNRSLVVILIRLDGTVERGKVEAAARDRAGQMVTEMPVARAAEDDRADLLEELQTLAALGGSNAEPRQRPMWGCSLATAPDFMSITTGSGSAGLASQPYAQRHGAGSSTTAG
jgi:hypothetical protein